MRSKPEDVFLYVCVFFCLLLDVSNVFIYVHGSKSALSCHIMNNALSACPSAVRTKRVLNRVVYYMFFGVRQCELNFKVIDACHMCV